MSVPRHLEEAAARLEDAKRRIEALKDGEATPDTVRDWLMALTDLCLALADIQAFDNQSIHEKLHEIAARAGVETAALRPR